jgi:hypothetical protein
VTPTEFKSRFIASLPPIPDDIDLSLDEFSTFPNERIANLRIRDVDRRLLAECGLPIDAPPFLSFGLSADRVLMPLDDFPDSVAIGHNGSGDMICIDQAATGAVVYYNHDNQMQRVFMNSSILQFAECLCLFSEFMRTKDAETFARHVELVDSPALAAGSFWPNEVRCELDI